MNRPSSYAVQVQEPVGAGSAEGEAGNDSGNVPGPARAVQRFKVQ